MDVRHTMLLLHSVSGVPGAQLFTARELAKKSVRTTVEHSWGKPEVTFFFASNAPTDVDSILLRFDPDKSGVCTRRLVKLKNGLSIDSTVESFVDHPIASFLPARIVVKDSSSPAGLHSTIDLSYSDFSTPSDAEFNPPFPENSYVLDRAKNVFMVWGKNGPTRSLTVAQFRELTRPSDRGPAPRLKAATDWFVLGGWTIGGVGLAISAWWWFRMRA